MALGRPLGAKLFLEGIEVPFIGATMTYTVGQASIAYVDLVPHAAINDIKPRTNVVVAVRDFNNREQNYPYVVAWEGEVFGYQFGKSVNSRSFSVSCIDTTSYWDNALTYFLNAQQSLGKGGFDMLREGLDEISAVKQGFGFIKSNDGPTASYFSQIVTNTLKDSTKNFLDAFVDVLKSVTKVNDFYKFAEGRLRIQDRILLNSTGLLKSLIDQAQGAAWFEGIVGKAGGFTSVRSVVMDLCSIIFHDAVTVPFPARVSVSKLSGSKLSGLSSNETTTIGSYVFKPNVYMLPPPLCNIFFPDEYSQFQFSRNFFKEPTRFIYRPELPFYQSATSVALPYQFEPDSFDAFMLGRDLAQYKGTADFSITGDSGNYLDKTAGSPQANYVESTPYVREGQFLTNEERMKGIWFAQESMFPAATQFAIATAGSAQFKSDFTKKISRYLFYKKRFESRAIQITSHLKLSVIPGFNVLILDDSVAEQQVLAYCDSVTHRVYATEGGYTNTTLSYARTPEEEAAASTAGNEPPIPPWFDPAVFGAPASGAPSMADPEGVAAAGTVNVYDSNLSKFYLTLIGAKGYKAITDYNKDETTVIGAVAAILAEYRSMKEKGAEDLQGYIAQITGRDYVKVRDSMAFLGATLPDKVELKSENTFNVFSGGAFSPDDSINGPTTKLRQAPITKYRDALQLFRGFRG